MNRYIVIFSIFFGVFFIRTQAQNIPKLPILPAFEENVGQFEEATFYQMNTNSGNIKFCQNKVKFTYIDQSATIDNQQIASQFGTNSGILKEKIVKGHTWEMVFDAKLNAKPKAEDLIQSNFRFFGNGSTKSKRIERYRKIRYANAFDQCDVLFYLDERSNLIKYDIILRPGAILNSIKVIYNGIDSLGIDSLNRLDIHTSLGIFKESQPIAFLSEQNASIDMDYQVSDNILSFTSNGLNDKYLKETLIIDPAFLTWSTFIYGTSKREINGSNPAYNRINGIEMDDKGFLYLLGYSNMEYKIVTKYFDSAYSQDYLEHIDFFFCKLNPQGDSIIYFNMVGTSKSDFGHSIQISKAGEALICGATGGPTEFPTTKDAYNGTTGGSFVMQFNADGDSIVLSTFYSAYNNTSLTKAMFFPPNEILVIGVTDNEFIPITANALQSKFGGGFSDGIILKFSADGKNLNYASFLGGSSNDFIADAVIGERDDIIIVGRTKSYDFPTANSNKDFITFHGLEDGFVTKFDSTFSKMEFSNLIGGSSQDVFESVAVNEQYQIYISGYSYSTDFPLSIYPKAYQQKNNGQYDMVVVRLSSDGNNINNSTYLGGSMSESRSGNTQIGLNAKGEVWLIGQSASDDFPITSDAFQKTNDTIVGKSNVTLSKFSPNLDKLLYSSYFGGKNGEYVLTNSIKRLGCITHILFGGFTSSINLPTTKDALMPNPPEDSAFDSKLYINLHTIGFATRFTDTLKLDYTSFGESDILRCNEFLEILDGQNQGANRRWSTQDSGQYLLLSKPGTYWYQATYGCDTLRDSFTIIQQFGPKTALAKDTFICDKQPITLNAQNDTIHAKFLWNTADTTSQINVHKSGKYWVTISTAHCGSITDTINVNYITSPILNLPDDTIVCNKDSIILDIGNENNFLHSMWQDSSLMNRYVVRNTGMYKVVVENVCGKDSASVQITFANNPKPFSLFRDTTICKGEEFVAKTGISNNLETYQWKNTSTQEILSDSDTLYIDQSGNYVVYTSNVCGSVVDSFAVSYLLIPAIGLDSVYSPCEGKALILTAGKASNQENYIWSNKDIASTTTFTQSGNHWVQINNKCGSDFMYFTINYITQPKANFNNAAVCEGKSFLLRNTSIGINSQTGYYWRLGDGNISTDKEPSYSYTKTGNARTFLVGLKVMASKDCADSITLPINVNITPSADFEYASQKSTLYFTPKNIVIGNKYTWNFGDGDSSSDPKPNHTFLADSGTYRVCLAITNADQCSDTVCKEVYFSVGVADIQKPIFKIYPNPTEGKLYFVFDQPGVYNVRITDVLGREIFETSFTEQEHLLQLPETAKGTFLILVTNENGELMQQVMMKK